MSASALLGGPRPATEPFRLAPTPVIWWQTGLCQPQADMGSAAHYLLRGQIQYIGALCLHERRKTLRYIYRDMFQKPSPLKPAGQQLVLASPLGFAARLKLLLETMQNEKELKHKII